MSADAAPLRWEDLTAVDAAWSVARGRLPDFERWVGGPFREALASRVGEGRVLAFLPVSHKPRRRTREAPSWSYWMLVLAAPGADAPELADTIAALAGDSGADLRSVGRARPQPSLDMVYPVDGPARERRLLQSIEYVFSKPAERPDYYRSQYEFSGPAMRRLHQRDRAGRFIGVEITERLHGDLAMPLWDVVHVSGFTVAQTLRLPLHFGRAFRDSATALGGPTARARMSRWTRQRDKMQLRVRQNMAATIAAPELVL